MEQEYLCQNCEFEFDIDVLNVQYHLYTVRYCPNCGSPMDDDNEYN